MLCPDRTFRTGGATPENNVCKAVPSGAFVRWEGACTGVAWGRCRRGRWRCRDCSPLRAGSLQPSTACSAPPVSVRLVCVLHLRCFALKTGRTLSFTSSAPFWAPPALLPAPHPPIHLYCLGHHGPAGYFNDDDPTRLLPSGIDTEGTKMIKVGDAPDMHAAAAAAGSTWPQPPRLGLGARSLRVLSTCTPPPVCPPPTPHPPHPTTTTTHPPPPKQNPADRPVPHWHHRFLPARRHPRPRRRAQVHRLRQHRLLPGSVWPGAEVGAHLRAARG